MKKKITVFVMSKEKKKKKKKESTDVNAKLRQAILNKKENNTPENTEDILKSSRKILP